MQPLSLSPLQNILHNPPLGQCFSERNLFLWIASLNSVLLGTRYSTNLKRVWWSRAYRTSHRGTRWPCYVLLSKLSPLWRYVVFVHWMMCCPVGFPYTPLHKSGLDVYIALWRMFLKGEGDRERGDIYIFFLFKSVHWHLVCFMVGALTQYMPGMQNLQAMLLFVKEQCWTTPPLILIRLPLNWWSFDI